MHVIDLRRRQPTSFKHSYTICIFLSLTHRNDLFLLINKVHVPRILQVIEIVIIVIINIIICEIIARVIVVRALIILLWILRLILGWTSTVNYFTIVHTCSNMGHHLFPLLFSSLGKYLLLL